MANGIVAASINRTTVGHALRIMRREYAHNATALNALNKASVELSMTIWSFDGEALVIESRTNIGHKYTVTAQGCDGSCKARGSHWHQQAYELLVRAARIVTQPAKPRMSDAEYERVLALCDEL